MQSANKLSFNPGIYKSRFPKYNNDHATDIRRPLVNHDDLNAAVERALHGCTWYRIQCVSIKDAAEILGIAACTVRDWIHSGKLAASTVGREYLIRLIDIETMLATNANVRPMDKRLKRNRKTIPNQ